MHYENAFSRPRPCLRTSCLLTCFFCPWRSLTPPCLDSNAVTHVQIVGDDTVVSADSGGKTIVWNVRTGEEKTELPGSKVALSNHSGREQQAGRFICTFKGDLLLIHAIEDGGAAGGADQAARAPVAFFRAPSPIRALDCSGAAIGLGCESGEVLQLRAAVLVT